MYTTSIFRKIISQNHNYFQSKVVQFCVDRFVLGGATGGAAGWIFGVIRGENGSKLLLGIWGLGAGTWGSIEGGLGMDNLLKSSPYSKSKSSEELENLGICGGWGTVSEVLWSGLWSEVGGCWSGGFSSKGSKIMSSGVSVPPKAIRSSSGESPCNKNNMSKNQK